MAIQSLGHTDKELRSRKQLLLGRDRSRILEAEDPGAKSSSTYFQLTSESHLSFLFFSFNIYFNKCLLSTYYVAAH
jgi:hypothetical protein